MPSRSPNREPVFPPERRRSANGFSIGGRMPAGTAGAQGSSGTERSVRQSGGDGRSASGLRIPGGRDGGGGGGGPGPWRGGNASGWTDEEFQPEAQPRGRAPLGNRRGLGGRGVRRGRIAQSARR